MDRSACVSAVEPVRKAYSARPHCRRANIHQRLCCILSCEGQLTPDLGSRSAGQGKLRLGDHDADWPGHGRWTRKRQPLVNRLRGWSLEAGEERRPHVRRDVSDIKSSSLSIIAPSLLLPALSTPTIELCLGTCAVFLGGFEALDPLSRKGVDPSTIRERCTGRCRMSWQ